MRYKIAVRTLQGRIITFKVDSYKILDGFVVFKDRITGKPKRFHGSNCEINDYNGRDINGN